MAERTDVERAADRFRVEVGERNGGWRVRILEREGPVLVERAFGDASQAEVFASTIRQHASWLSASKFREYYRPVDRV